MRGSGIVGVAVFAAGFVAGSAEAKSLYQWAQLGPGETATVRAISDGTCPEVVIDGVAKPMIVRSRPAQAFGNVARATFTVTGCEIPLPAGSRTAIIEGEPIALPKPNPKRIVVFGDTGCRIKNGDPVQSCNDPQSWPFPEVARRAAAARPDLVIHVGDYLYREDPCPAASRGCAGTPFGYGWNTWDVDFFKPADPLLRSAPWVFVRGNHEDCNRAAEGWFRWLDREPMQQQCRDLSGVYVSKLGDFGIVNVDGAGAADNVKDAPGVAAQLRRQFGDVLKDIPGEAWLVTHRPLDAIAPTGDGAANKVENRLQSEALSGLIPASVKMLLAGHVHFFQAVDFGGSAPPQLVVGTGGDNLEPIPPMSLAGSRINGKTVSRASAWSGFAFMVWDRTGPGWTGTLYGFDGQSVDQCSLTDRRLSCRP